MRRALSWTAGLVVAVGVLAVAWLFATGLSGGGAELVLTLPGPGGVTAEHRRGPNGTAKRNLDVVDLTSGRRRVEVLRLDGDGAVGLEWLDAARLKICIGAARVLRHVADATLGGDSVHVFVAPLPATDCAP